MWLSRARKRNCGARRNTSRPTSSSQSEHRSRRGDSSRGIPERRRARSPAGNRRPRPTSTCGCTRDGCTARSTLASRSPTGTRSHPRSRCWRGRPRSPCRAVGTRRTTCRNQSACIRCPWRCVAPTTVSAPPRAGAPAWRSKNAGGVRAPPAGAQNSCGSFNC